MITQNQLINLLANSLYYPACDIDGGVIKYCNEHFDELGINNYVYADYGIEEQRLVRHIDSFLGYYLADSNALSSADLGFDLSQITSSCQGHDKEMVDIHSTKKPFARLSVYEREMDFGPEHGPDSFNLLFLGVEGVTVYENLYLANGIVPKAMAIIQPGTGYGGNWTDFRNPSAPLCLTVKKSKTMPESFFYGGIGDFSYDDLEWPRYALIDEIRPYYHHPNSHGAVTVWKRVDD